MDYDYIVEVEKFNPYHDAKGRFSSKTGGGSPAGSVSGRPETNPSEERRVWAKPGGGGGSYTAGGSAYKPGGTYGEREFKVPPSDGGMLTVNIAPRASGFQDGKYVGGNQTTAILNDGNIVVTDGYDVREKVRFAVQTEVERLGGATKAGVFFRGTNNKNEIDLLESGKLRNSKNHDTGESEDGVSVWDGMRYQEYKYTYKVTGTIVGQGSDGEPVLDPKTMKVVGGMKPTGTYAMEFNAAKEAGQKVFCETYGWSSDQLQQAIRGGYKKEQLMSRAAETTTKKSFSNRFDVIHER